MGVHRPRLTEAERNEILRRVRAGESALAIAWAIGRTRRLVSRVLERTGSLNCLLVRQLIIGLGAIILLLLAAGLSYILRVGPLAPPTAARSVVFVAISRGIDEADAREIEAIDLDAGTRDLFDVGGGPITAMALSADRRSLYVALGGGKIVLLDATTGSRFGAVDLGGPPVVSLVPTPDDRTLFALAVTNTETSVVPIDLATKKAADPVLLPPTTGAAVIRGDALIVPFNDAQGLEVAYLDVNTRALRSRLTIPRGSLGGPAAFPIGDALMGVVAFDTAGPAGMGIRLYVVSDPSHWREMLVAAPDPRGPFGYAPAAASADGAIHLCAAQGLVASRYVFASADLTPTQVGSDCGPLAGGDQILMATRDSPRLLVLDAKSGKTVRTLALAGAPVRLVH